MTDAERRTGMDLDPEAPAVDGWRAMTTRELWHEIREVAVAAHPAPPLLARDSFAVARGPLMRAG